VSQLLRRITMFEMRIPKEKAHSIWSEPFHQIQRAKLCCAISLLTHDLCVLEEGHNSIPLLQLQIVGGLTGHCRGKLQFTCVHTYRSHRRPFTNIALTLFLALTFIARASPLALIVSVAFNLRVIRPLTEKKAGQPTLESCRGLWLVHCFVRSPFSSWAACLLAGRPSLS